MVIKLFQFIIKNKCHYSLYDVTRKEYRKTFPFFAILDFEKKYFARKKVEITRSYGWRDSANEKLLKHAIRNFQIPDGVTIYNMRKDIVPQPI